MTSISSSTDTCTSQVCTQRATQRRETAPPARVRTRRRQPALLPRMLGRETCFQRAELLAYMLLIAGFRHSAFTFGCESMVAKSNINGAKIPPGELINLIQKGVLYTELEKTVTDDGGLVDDDPEPFSLVTRDLPSIEAKARGDAADASSSRAAPAKQEPPSEGEGGGRPTPMETEETTDDGPSTNGLGIDSTPDEQVTTLAGHTSEVFICSWSPTSQQLASGSGDSTARIWRVPEGACGGGSAPPTPVVLQHLSGDKEKSKDVTTLDWNHDGTRLATGSYDGLARIWTANGELASTLKKHTGPIFSLKWNRTGEYLLSGSVDKTAVVWDAATGAVKQEYAFHKEPTLDVDWRDETSFASCSTDRMIYVCKLGEENHLQCFQGHTDEVNAIKWDPSGQLLASCSDDYTAKVWSMSSGSNACVQDLCEHRKEIYTIKWSPTGAGSANPNANLVLATASFDSTVRVWDPETGVCLYVLEKHTEPVYSVAFSSNGQYLASGSFDKCLHIWSAKDGTLLKTYRGHGGIFEVSWNAEGNKVAACFANNVVSVLDFRM